MMRQTPKPLSWIWKLVRTGAILLILIPVLEYLVIPRLTGAQKSLHLLAKVNFAYVAIGVMLEIAALIAYALLTKSLLPHSKFPSLFKIFRINLSTLSLSHILPGGTASGTALGYRLLTSQNVTGANATFCLATSGIGSAVVLNVILWLSLIISIPFRSVNNPLYAGAAIIGSLLLGLFALLIFLLTKGEDHVATFFEALFKRIPFISSENAVSNLRSIAKSLDDLKSDREKLVSALVFASLNWLLDASSLWIFILAFGKLISPVDLLVAYGVANVLAAIPITPGGLGVIEGVLIPTLHGFGAPSNVALLAVLSYRLVNFWIPIPLGGISYLTLRFSKSNYSQVSNQS